MIIPRGAEAFSITSFLKNLFGNADAEEVVDAAPAQLSDESEKPFPFLTPIQNSDPQAVQHNSGLQIVDHMALVAASGPLGTDANVQIEDNSYRITTYKVRKGDSMTLIAKTFGVSPATIRWANDLQSGAVLKEGQTLVILPISGVQHVVKKGDTVTSLAKKYGGDPDEIYDFNGLTQGDQLEVGSVVIIPDGEITLPPETSSPPSTSQSPALVRGGGLDIRGYYRSPLASYTRTQGFHGYNGVDLANSCGAPVTAAASGSVIIARASGWNGGYGKYIVISHANGTQTLYSHLSAVDVVPGYNVAQGQRIGLVGATGKSTGCHLHFEVRGARNPF